MKMGKNTKQKAQTMDEQVVQELTEHAYKRLCDLVSRQLGSMPTVRKFENTGDVLHTVIVKILEKQIANPPDTPLDYFKEVSRGIRHHLIDELRKIVGRRKAGSSGEDSLPARNRASLFGSGADVAIHAINNTFNPQRIQMWAEFHESVEELPEEQKSVVDLLFYFELTQTQAAKTLKISRDQVSRHWRQARISLAKVTPTEHCKE
jgi:RNA polymerase sigma-70 factor (ECF subfamily)